MKGSAIRACVVHAVQSRLGQQSETYFAAQRFNSCTEAMTCWNGQASQDLGSYSH